ncbi:MAG TPA: IS4 family transposase [Candidatus Tectomicrobia bacterium]|nr:IS4 family transposase [Candidatus Tectomicrobia bacterium]
MREPNGALQPLGRRSAQRGGFLSRTGAGEPGIQAIWEGDQRLHEFSYAREAHRRVNAL